MSTPPDPPGFELPLLLLHGFRVLIDELHAERLGYTERAPDPADARRKVVRLTSRAIDALDRSARVFDDLRAGWAQVIGRDRLRALEADLRKVTSAEGFRLDIPGWLGSP
jgi:hypothetical protein